MSSEQGQVVPSERIGLNGSFDLVHIAPDGHVIQTRHVKNLVVSVGKAQVAGFINGSILSTTSVGGTGGFIYLAIGSATSATGASDVGLGVEFSSNGGARAVATTRNRTTTSVANDTAQWVLTYTCSAGTLAVGEAGIFDTTSSGAGDMLARQPFALINLSSGDSLQVTWKVQVS